MQLVRRARQRVGSQLTVMTSISFYLGNRRRVFAHLCYLIHGGQTENQGGQTKNFFGASRRIFSKNLCPPWPETVPAPLVCVTNVLLSRERSPGSAAESRSWQAMRHKSVHLGISVGLLK